MRANLFARACNNTEQDANYLNPKFHMTFKTNDYFAGRAQVNENEFLHQFGCDDHCDGVWRFTIGTTVSKMNYEHCVDVADLMDVASVQILQRTFANCVLVFASYYYQYKENPWCQAELLCFDENDLELEPKRVMLLDCAHQIGRTPKYVACIWQNYIVLQHSASGELFLVTLPKNYVPAELQMERLWHHTKHVEPYTMVATKQGMLMLSKNQCCIFQGNSTIMQLVQLYKNATFALDPVWNVKKESMLLVCNILHTCTYVVHIEDSMAIKLVALRQMGAWNDCKVIF